MRKRVQDTVAPLWFGLLFALSSCGGLPEYAAPKQGSMDLANPLAGDLIPYRNLARSDFRGKDVPEAFRAVKDRVGAATCARIVSDPPARMELTTTTEPNGDVSVAGRILSVSYRALMDRGCSWWNDQLQGLDPAYVLEHEQIHFALFEIEARHLDRRAKALAEDETFEGDSAESVKANIEGALQELLDDTNDTLLERNRDFDEDTSLGYEPKRQREWFDKVSSELSETE